MLRLPIVLPGAGTGGVRRHWLVALAGDGNEVSAELVGEIEDALGLADLVANEARECFTVGGGGIEKLQDGDADLGNVEVAEGELGEEEVEDDGRGCVD